jgi:hypothetical protein
LSPTWPDQSSLLAGCLWWEAQNPLTTL